MKNYTHLLLTIVIFIHPLLLIAEQPFNQPNPSQRPHTSFEDVHSGNQKEKNVPNTHTTDTSSLVPEVSDQIVKDIMKHYPEVAERVKLLQNERINPELLPKTMLLVGEPGCSKTTIAIAIAQVLKRKIAYFEATSLVGNRYQNSGVEILREKLDSINEEMRNNPHTKYVVIVDEIMRLAEKFEHEKGEGKDISTELWLIIDRFKKSDRVFFIATANDVDKLPDQLRSRIARHNIIEIKPPEADYRRKILLNHMKVEHSLSKSQFDELIKDAEGLTHREIEELVASATHKALVRCSEKPILLYNDLNNILTDLKSQGWFDRWIEKPLNKTWDKHGKTIDQVGKTIIYGAALAGLIATGVGGGCAIAAYIGTGTAATSAATAAGATFVLFLKEF